MLIQMAISGSPTTLLTLTINPERFETKEKSHDALKYRLNLFVRMERLERPKMRTEYLGVVEATSAGWPHMHVLMRAPYIPQSEISDYFGKYLGSPIVDIRAVTHQAAVAGYVAKYLGKAPERFGNGKRYVKSLGWESAAQKAKRLEVTAPKNWHVWDKAPFLVVEELETMGAKFFPTSDGGWWSPPIFRCAA